MLLLTATAIALWLGNLLTGFRSTLVTGVHVFSVTYHSYTSQVIICLSNTNPTYQYPAGKKSDDEAEASIETPSFGAGGSGSAGVDLGGLSGLGAGAE